MAVKWHTGSGWPPASSSRLEGAGTIRSVTLLIETINSLLSYCAQLRLEHSTTACAYPTQTTEWGAPCAQQYFVRMLLVRVMSGFHLWCYSTCGGSVVAQLPSDPKYDEV